jgi:UPF0755 protein
MKTSNKKRLGYMIVVLLAGALCLVVIAIAWVVVSMPERAAANFGPASPNLSKAQLYSYSIRLELQREKLLTATSANVPGLAINIQAGDSIQAIADNLFQAGLLSDRDLFVDYLVYAGLDTKIQAGKHTLNSQMNAVEIAQELIDPTPEEVTFGLLAGWRVEEIAALIPASGLNFSKEVFLTRVLNPSGTVDTAFWGSPATLEGLLAPGEFIVAREISLDAFLDLLVSRQEEMFTPEIVSQLENLGLSPYDGLILASIVEREAVVDEEKPLIASVFLNRLAIRMRLDSDPTVQYAVGFNEEQGVWWTNPISLSNLQIDSPYNTYIYAGLPPSPICTPSQQAIEAVANPAKTPYYYFRAACDGSGTHLFAESYEEHLLNACP